jgi:bifunctional DNA-binding transcriptional regulator/antitoxin component of YhaV-PrlF toxin-antitoxin module
MGADRRRMEQLTKGLPSKSEKMRTLAGAGYARTDIARFLGTRYQFVRNVLVQDAQRKSARAQPAAAGRASDDLVPVKVKLGPDGRMVIPVALRTALSLKEGDVLFASADQGELRLLTIPAAVRRAQAIVRQFVPEGVSLVDELIGDRRRETAREEQDG